jgi:hypothetical protein
MLGKSPAELGCEIVKVYKDHGISGAKGRDKRPAFDALIRDANQRKFDMVMAWSVDRLGRSLQDLVSFLSELHALHIDLFLHQQGLDTASRCHGDGTGVPSFCQTPPGVGPPNASAPLPSQPIGSIHLWPRRKGG